MTEVRLTDEVVEDILAAVKWYEGQREDLGVEFTVELDMALQRIAEGSETYAVQYRDMRRVLLRRFPYAIYFVLRDNIAHVLAVLHQHQNPAEWQTRPDR